MDIFVNLDVGGQNFRMLRTTVMKYPECLVVKALKGECQESLLQDNIYFFDRNPRYFEVILDFMRNQKIYRKNGLNQEQLRNEIQFWGMSSYMDIGSRKEEKDFDKVSEYVTSNTKYTDNRIKSQPQTQVKLVNNEEYHPTLIMNEEYQPTLIMNEEYQPTLIMNEEYQPTLAMNEEYQPTLIMNEEDHPALLSNQEIQPDLSRQGSTDTQSLDEIPQIQDSTLSNSPSALKKSLNPGILTNDLVSSILSEAEVHIRLAHPTPKAPLTKQPSISQEEIKSTSLSKKESTNLRAAPKPSAPVPKQNPNKRERVLPWQSSTPTKSRTPKKANTVKYLATKKPRLVESQESLGSVDINESYESSFIDDTEEVEYFSEDLDLDESDSEAEYKPTKKCSKKSPKSASKSRSKSRKGK